MIYTGVASFFGLGLEDSHVATIWLLLQIIGSQPSRRYHLLPTQRDETKIRHGQNYDIRSSFRRGRTNNTEILVYPTSPVGTWEHSFVNNRAQHFSVLFTISLVNRKGMNL